MLLLGQTPTWPIQGAFQMWERIIEPLSDCLIHYNTHKCSILLSKQVQSTPPATNLHVTNAVVSSSTLPDNHTTQYTDDYKCCWQSRIPVTDVKSVEHQGLLQAPYCIRTLSVTVLLAKV